MYLTIYRAAISTAFLCPLWCIAGHSGAAGSEPSHQGVSSELQDCLENAYSWFTAIRTLEINGTVIDSNSSWKARFEYSRDGDKFRANRKDIQGNLIDVKRRGVDGKFTIEKARSNLSFDRAFDGAVFQVHDKKRDALTNASTALSPRISCGFEPPVEVLYSWLVHPALANAWEKIGERDTWDNRFKQASFVETVEVGGRLCSKVRFPDLVDPKNWSFVVWFSKGKSGLPVRYERQSYSSGDATCVCEAQSLRAVTSADGTAILFPHEIIYEEKTLDRMSSVCSRKYEIVPGSVNINYEIKDSRFQIPRSAAKHFRDLDEQAAKLLQAKAQHELLGEKQLSMSSHNGVWRSTLIWINVAAVVLLGSFFAYTKLWK